MKSQFQSDLTNNFFTWVFTDKNCTFSFKEWPSGASHTNLWLHHAHHPVNHFYCQHSDYHGFEQEAHAFSYQPGEYFLHVIQCLSKFSELKPFLILGPHGNGYI
jgi:hypothetical protein